MAEINLSLNGKNYGIACDDGQEGRVSDLGKYVDMRLREIASAGGASNDAHLLVLTAIVLADEIYELRAMLRNGGVAANANKQRVSEDEERQIIEAINHLALRIDTVADRLQKVA